MRTSTMLKGLLAMLAGFALAGAAAAQAPDGVGELSGKGRIKATGCGSHKDPVSVFFEMFTDGDWYAEIGFDEFSGTSEPVKSNERNRNLTFDAGSLADLDASIEAAASELCGTAVTGTLETPKATVKVNKREDRARVRFRATGTNGSDKATLRVNAKGDWGPLVL